MARLFISHAEKDIGIVRAFVELLYRIGLREDNIFCSSISELGVPLKEDIYDYLRNLLDEDTVIPVFMLSENYYSSAACLNEMGAVWLKQKDYYTFLLPGFTFKEIKGAINPNKRAIKLDKTNDNLSGDLTDFKISINKTFHLSPISDQRWELYRKEFTDILNNSFQNGQNDQISFNINESRPYCINDVNHDACVKTVDSIANKIVFHFDFQKTTSQLCSLVIFTGGIDIRSAYRAGKKLEFSIKGSPKLKEVCVEMHLSSMNPFKVIQVDKEWQKYRIPLAEFTTLENLWECCKEVCFVVDRNSTRRGTFEVRDIRII